MSSLCTKPIIITGQGADAGMQFGKLLATHQFSWAPITTANQCSVSGWQNVSMFFQWGFAGVVAEQWRQWTSDLLGSPRVGLNPADNVSFNLQRTRNKLFSRTKTKPALPSPTWRWRRRTSPRVSCCHVVPAQDLPLTVQSCIQTRSGKTPRAWLSGGGSVSWLTEQEQLCDSKLCTLFLPQSEGGGQSQGDGSCTVLAVAGTAAFLLKLSQFQLFSCFFFFLLFFFCVCFSFFSGSCHSKIRQVSFK